MRCRACAAAAEGTQRARRAKSSAHSWASRSRGARPRRRLSSRGETIERSPWRKPEATKARYERPRRSSTRDASLRSIASTPVSTDGGGSNERAGRRRRSEKRYQAPQRTSLRVLGQGSDRFMATLHSTITSARLKGTRGSSRRWRRIAVVRSNGRLATTRKGSVGRAISTASPSTTSASRQRPRRYEAQRGSSSTAITRRALFTRAPVSRPLPAPMSRTRSLERTPASRTIAEARASVRRKCWLRAPGRACRARRAATEDHRHSR